MAPLIAEGELTRRGWLAGAGGVALTAGLASCTGKPPALPGQNFFLFGEGSRTKLLYQAGKLRELDSGRVVWSEAVEHERFQASETAILLQTERGPVRIHEDETGVWAGGHQVVAGGLINRPRFEQSPHAKRLRALHHEILVNIVGGAPIPNLLVYDTPWRRDAAMAAMCLQATGNLHLIRDWVIGLTSPYDGAAGEHEPDNIGQTLYLLGLLGQPHHPLVATCVSEVERFRRGKGIAGVTDGHEYPVYQTLWLNKGLQAVGRPARYEAPMKPESYGNLAWWSPAPRLPYPRLFSRRAAALYPYLSWAEAHSLHLPPPALPDVDAFPQTWEAEAAKADYQRLRPLGLSAWADAKIAGPHLWHAAEAFLYLLGARS